jgi:hypothetical protein
MKNDYRTRLSEVFITMSKLAIFIAGILITCMTIWGIYGNGNIELVIMGHIIMWSLYFIAQGVLWWVVAGQGMQDVYQDVTKQRRL